ncbi:TPA_asm: coat protein [ssRNA phage Zoerhiza.2_29]|uniref:Coat protein n=2 Tax=Fiersviridae TaxID=2842319 RepID=A0A8S5L313_9VIRU|nr:coat protein [ssRNA phage Zoerhiza.2_29]QDH86586.1 MAG: hypothetical protein H2Rhizo33814_000002 [Leviviridae sp.]DAD52040.1 TPA_asm: coat protein [ssRNA phage Zoerhiza.2_29]
MAAFASVVLQDHAAVDVTFLPRNLEGGIATFVSSDGVPVNDKKITLNMGRPSATGRRKVNIKIAIPVVQDVVVAGVSRPTVVRTAYADMTFQFESTSSLTERADIRDFAYNLLGKAVIVDAIDKVEGPW